MKLLETLPYDEQPDFVLGVLERGEDLDALMYAVGELSPMDTVLLLAQVRNASPPELEDRVDAFAEEAHRRYLSSYGLSA